MTRSLSAAEKSNQNRFAWVNKLKVEFFICYVLLVASGLIGMHQLRTWALQTYDTSNARRDWTQWQDETERQSQGEGPVERRKAKSNEPPALVLARDYYLTLAVMFVLFGTILFAAIALLIRGALTSPGRVRDD